LLLGPVRQWLWSLLGPPGTMSHTVVPLVRTVPSRQASHFGGRDPMVLQGRLGEVGTCRQEAFPEGQYTWEQLPHCGRSFGRLERNGLGSYYWSRGSIR
jgi:hypothetical protein